MLRKNIGATALLTLGPFSLFAQEGIVDTLKNRPHILKQDKIVKSSTTINFPKRLDVEVIGSSYGAIRRRPRYGTYYFDYKFDIPLDYVKPKKDSAIMAGFIVPDTLQDPVTRLEIYGRKKRYKNTPAEDFIERNIVPHVLSYDQLIYVQMRNPVKVPEYRKPLSQVYLVQKTRQEQIEDSIAYARRKRAKNM
ncbi:hypothetical protein [uncultured Acetobacteroides sp.]|uniref:hypothetical protein n=1 Tax=uncultured Acetobacteroides sp. TaxID=1760811 RepID=UPI0029F51033|nr:hypothetical protein [uncultured Acetobacteroides sp.]